MLSQIVVAGLQSQKAWGRGPLPADLPMCPSVVCACDGRVTGHLSRAPWLPRPLLSLQGLSLRHPAGCHPLQKAPVLRPSDVAVPFWTLPLLHPSPVLCKGLSSPDPELLEAGTTSCSVSLARAWQVNDEGELRARLARSKDMGSRGREGAAQSPPTPRLRISSGDVSFVRPWSARPPPSLSGWGPSDPGRKCTGFGFYFWLLQPGILFSFITWQLRSGQTAPMFSSHHQPEAVFQSRG